MTTELKPCPLCGCAPQAVPQNGYRTLPDGAWTKHIWCENCGAQSGEKDTEAEAIAAWNRRATTPPETRPDAGGDVVERVARLVDPHAWEQRSRFLGILRGEGRQPEDAEQRAMMRRSAENRVETVVAPSLALSRTILAALPVPVDANEAMRAACQAFIDRWDSGDRADTDYVVGLMRAALAAAKVGDARTALPVTDEDAERDDLEGRQ